MLKSPSVDEIIKDPNLAERLTIPQLQRFVVDLESILGPIKSKNPSSPAKLAEKYSRGAWTNAPHLEMLTSWLVDLYRGKRERVLVSFPPRHGKSELISHWFPIWFLSMDPSKKVILASYEQDFATQWGRRVRNAIIDFGGELGLNLEPSSTAASRWDLTTGGGMLSVGAGGPITGRGAHCLIIDDPIKNYEDASSERIREGLWDWWVSTAFTRLEPGGFVVIIGTRWHEDDLIGRLERNSKAGGQQWDVLRLPALAEENDPLGRPVDEPLWPIRFPYQKLLDIKLGMTPLEDGQPMTPYKWASLYQQRPTPEEGGAIKRTWWNWYTALPADFDAVIQAWDLAFKDLKESDYTVGQVWGRKGASFYLIHQVRARMDAPETIKAFRNMWAMFPRSQAKLIEDKANGPAVIATLRNEIPGVIPWPPRGQRMASKDARLSAISHLIEAKNVYLPRPEVAPWITEFVEECAVYPNGSNDDQLDAMVHALTYFQPQAWGVIRTAMKEAKIGPPPTTTQDILAREFNRSIQKAITNNDKQINDKNVYRPQHRRLKIW